jgi:hypothetical protein
VTRPRVTVRSPSLYFDDEADAAPLGTVHVGNSSRAATAILALFFLCESSLPGRRPSACNAVYEEAPSEKRHGHGVLSYWKAADKDGSSVIHGRCPFAQNASPHRYSKDADLIMERAFVYMGTYRASFIPTLIALAQERDIQSIDSRK